MASALQPAVVGDLDPLALTSFTEQDPQPDVIDATQRLLRWAGPLDVRPILKGGSGRQFFRVRDRASGDSVIAMTYTDERRENALFPHIARFLISLGVRVPALIHHDPAHRFIWCEDLGERDLHALRLAPWDQRGAAYRSALDSARVLHDTPLQRLDGLVTMDGFDDALYAWERAYFFDHFVVGACNLPLPEIERADLDSELRPLAHELATSVPCLVHRDFQSQNILVPQDVAYLIDFQGMRPGSRCYDLASLIFDPYVDLSDAQRTDLLRYYHDLGPESQPWPAFQRQVEIAGLQRLMQALGAYGFLGLQRNKPEFLRHIPAGRDRLQHLADRLRLPRLSALLDRCSGARLPEP